MIVPPTRYGDQNLRSEAVLALVAMVCTLAGLYLGLQESVDLDEVYHLNAIWLTAHGRIPYRDFIVMHPPGQWVWLSPWPRLFSSGTAYFLSSRVLTALFFGGTVWMAGKWAATKGIQTVILGALALWILKKAEWYIYRAEYLACLLLFVHFFLLSRLRRVRVAGFSFLSMSAAAFIAVAATVSLRPAPFLLVQPGCMLISPGDRRSVGRWASWAVGLILGFIPVLIYFARHQLWHEGWFWIVRVPSSKEFLAIKGFMRVGVHIPREQALVLLVGTVALGIIMGKQKVSRAAKILFALSWLVAILYSLGNPFSYAYTFVSIYMLFAVLVSSASGTLGELANRFWRQRWNNVLRGFLISGILILLVAALTTGKPFALRFDRTIQMAHLNILGWLEKIAGGEAVVCVGPNHPIAADNAIDIMNAWTYARLISVAAIRERLAGAGGIILRRHPPVICAEPWLDWVGGRNLVDWLTYNGVIKKEEAGDIRALLSSQYDKVELTWRKGMPRGLVFWVRKDRLEKVGLPVIYGH